MMGRRVLGLCVAGGALFAAGCGSGADQVDVAASTGAIPMRIGDVELDSPVGGPLPGTGVGSSVVSTPDGATVFYASVSNDGTVPIVRQVDMVSGRESVAAESAYSPVVSADGGLLAFARPSKTGSDLVERDLASGDEAVVGSVSGILQPLFYAGKTLVAHRWDPEQQETFTVVWAGQDPPEEKLGTVKAVSPEGSQLVIRTVDPAAYLQVVEAQTLEPVASMPVETFSGGFGIEGAKPVAEAPQTDAEDALPLALGDDLGVWSGDEIILPALPGPVVIGFDGKTLEPRTWLDIRPGDLEIANYLVRPGADGDGVLVHLLLIDRSQVPNVQLPEQPTKENIEDSAIAHDRAVAAASTFRTLTCQSDRGCAATDADSADQLVWNISR